MSNIFSIIGTAWEFQRRQPILVIVLFWLIILPLTGQSIVMRFMTSASGMMTMEVSPQFVIGWLGILLFQLILLWGTACVLLIGGRLLSHNAGRSRSSFRAVHSQALTFVIPLFLTGILRACITSLWTLLFIIPGIIYQVRTVFYALITVCEKTPYRAALTKSKELVRGQTWRVCKYLLGLSILTFIPAYLLSTIASLMIDAVDSRFLPITDLIDGTVNGIALLFFTLSIVILYRDIQKNPRLIPPPPIEGTD
ncbi:hypothetical protein HYZ98_05300 [Candidatus Peregrinibacteria bacterium]|nr:hypothetical protein [Candidatus Peregrinibacteria bacterium]